MNKLFKLTVLFTLTIVFQFTVVAQQVDIATQNQSANTGKYFKDFGNNYQTFIGTWQTVVGDKTYQFTFWKTLDKPMGSPIDYHMDAIEGKFKIIKNLDMPNEELVFDSVKYYPQSNTTSNSVFVAISADGLGMGGIVEDNAANNGTYIITANFIIRLINSSGTPLMATWQIKFPIGGAGMNYSLPMSAVLTKIN